MISEESPDRNRSFEETDSGYLTRLARDRNVRKMFDLESETFYTTDEVAERLNIEKEVIRELIRKNELYAIKIGKSYRITNSDLQEFLSERYTRKKGSDETKNP